MVIGEKEGISWVGWLLKGAIFLRWGFKGGELNPNHRQFTLQSAEHKSQHSNAHLHIMACPKGGVAELLGAGNGWAWLVDFSKFEKQLAQIVWSNLEYVKLHLIVPTKTPGKRKQENKSSCRNGRGIGPIYMSVVFYMLASIVWDAK